MQQLAKIEQAEKAAGLRKEFTKEVSDYLGSRVNVTGKSLVMLVRRGYFRAVTWKRLQRYLPRCQYGQRGARPIRCRAGAFGAGIPYIPDEGVCSAA